jgi:dTDP-glucose 4,6-dehydratase
VIAREDLEHVLTHTRSLWDDLRAARIFITGGTGFVGTWLVESFAFANRTLSLGASAVLLSRNPGAFRERSPHLADDPAIALVQGDASEFERPDGVFPFVIHAATERAIEPDAGRPFGVFERDLAATKRVLELARLSGTRRLLFTSSGAVYGRQPPDLGNIPEDYAGTPETTAAPDGRSIYGLGKRVSEFFCAAYARQYGFTAPIARLFAFVGPYLPLDEQYAVGNFIRDVLSGTPIRIGGDGTPYRSYLYAADLAVWLWTILIRGQSCRPYNVGSPEAVTIEELAHRVAAANAAQTPIEVARRPTPGAQPTRYVPSTLRAENELGLRVRVPLDEGIRRTYDWHRRRRDGKMTVLP